MLELYRLKLVDLLEMFEVCHRLLVVYSRSFEILNNLNNLNNNERQQKQQINNRKHKTERVKKGNLRRRCSKN